MAQSVWVHCLRVAAKWEYISSFDWSVPIFIWVYGSYATVLWVRCLGLQAIGNIYRYFISSPLSTYWYMIALLLPAGVRGVGAYRYLIGSPLPARPACIQTMVAETSASPDHKPFMFD